MSASKRFGFTLALICVMSLWLAVFAQEQSQPLNFYTCDETFSDFNPVSFDGQIAEDGWIIQVVCAGPDGVVDPPIMTGPETGMPTGDDFLADSLYNNVQYFYFNSEENSIPPGNFCMLTSINCREEGFMPGEQIIRVGDVIYLRAFNSEQWSSATLFADLTNPYTAALQTAGLPLDVYGADFTFMGVDFQSDPGYMVTEYKLHQNYPNPFNPTTTIEYDVLESGKVYIKIYNVAGQEVARLVDGEFREGGVKYMCHWNAEGFSSGIYFYRFEVNDFKSVKKLLFLR